jgi:hypothetical protein
MTTFGMVPSTLVIHWEAISWCGVRWATSVPVNCIVLLLMSIIPSLSWFLALFLYLDSLPYMFIAYACADIFSVLLESRLVSLF